MHPISTAQSAVPLSYWIGFHLTLLVILAIELIYARRTRAGHPRRTAIVASALWIVAAIGFGFWVRAILGNSSAVQYLAGYAIEQSLSIDNLFVFLLLFRAFAIERQRQPKVLFWGVAGAMVMRGLFIAGGLALLTRFEFVSYIFGGVLLIAAIRLLLPQKAAASGEKRQPRFIAWLKRVHPISLRQDAFAVYEQGRPMVTVLLIALVAIELTDVVFALDSIPAVLSITRNPFLAYTSNIMAVMGLRSLYTILAGLLAQLRYLHLGLALILGFAAIKMLAARWVEIGASVSLEIILGLLAATIAASLLHPKDRELDQSI